MLKLSLGQACYRYYLNTTQMSPETKAKLINSLKDIHDYMGIAVADWLIFILVVCIISFLAYLIYKKLTKKNIIADEKPFFESLIEKLDKLKFESNDKKFYLTYSEMIRLYFNERSDNGFLDKTTEEIKEELRTIENLKTADMKFLGESLQRADLAKFAKKEYSAEQKLSDLEKTISILNEQETLFQERLAITDKDSNL